MRNRRLAYVDVCPICEMEIGPFDWPDGEVTCCPDCGWPRDKDKWLTREMAPHNSADPVPNDMDTHVIVREYPAAACDDQEAA